MKKPLLLSDLKDLVGKTIEWTAEAYKMNMPYHGIEKIIQIRINQRSPIIITQWENRECDNLCFAFVDDHTLIPIEDGFMAVPADGTNNCLSYSDSDREVFYEIINQ